MERMLQLVPRSVGHAPESTKDQKEKADVEEKVDADSRQSSTPRARKNFDSVSCSLAAACWPRAHLVRLITNTWAEGGIDDSGLVPVVDDAISRTATKVAQVTTALREQPVLLWLQLL